VFSAGGSLRNLIKLGDKDSFRMATILMHGHHLVILQYRKIKMKDPNSACLSTYNIQ